MRYALLPPHHYAATWVPDHERTPEQVTQLGIRFVSESNEARKQDLLLQLVQAYHGYLLKYVTMISLGTLPLQQGGRVNKDAEILLSMFVPAGQERTKAWLSQACRSLHLAFKQMDAGEVYDVLAMLLMQAIGKYDPDYHQKVKLVCEVIDKMTVPFLSEHILVGFDCKRIVWALVKKGFLKFENERFEKHSWPPPASFLKSEPMGLTMHVQTRFRFPVFRVPRATDFETMRKPIINPESRLCALLRRRRAELKLTQVDIAEPLGVVPETVGLWERGLRRMELDKLPRLAALLQVPAVELCSLALREFHPCLHQALFSAADGDD